MTDPLSAGQPNAVVESLGLRVCDIRIERGNFNCLRTFLVVCRDVTNSNVNFWGDKTESREF